jgi:RNA polymerase sigma factor (sigma-70 family)
MLRDIANPANQRRWADFCNLYQRPLRAYALNYVPHDEVDDVVQKIFIQVFTQQLKYDLSSPKGTFHRLLKKAIRFRSIDAQRRRKAREKHLAPVPQPKDGDSYDHLANLPDNTTGPASKAANREWSAIVPGLFEQASKLTQEQVGLEQFQLFEHYVMREWPVDKVAKTFGVTRNKVYLAKSRVSAVFQKEFKKLERARLAVSPPASAKPAR